MPPLAKATLQQLSGDPAGKPLGEPVPVQFNPTTLKLQLANSVEGGQTQSQSVRQVTGTGSSTLTLDLVFDTADEGTTDAPVSVLERTATVEAFLIPAGQKGQKQVPPRARFHWGKLIVDGVIDALTIDLDHFAHDGTPLRAKVSLALKEQKADLQLLKKGSGANDRGGAPAAGGLGAGLRAGAVGSVGVGLGAQASLALGGEAAADFAARVGLDAAAWRGLDLGGANPLSLSAGLEIGFDASIGAGLAVGGAVGFGAGVSLSVGAAFGLEAGATAAAGFAVAAGGGVAASVATVQAAAQQSAAAKEKAAFGLPAPAVPPARPGLPDQPRPAAVAGGLPKPWATSPPAPPPPRPDPRAAAFGRGLPLRPTVFPDTPPGAAPATTDRTVPPWAALPVRPAPTAARKPCGCRAACGCS